MKDGYDVFLDIILLITSYGFATLRVVLIQ